MEWNEDQLKKVYCGGYTNDAERSTKQKNTTSLSGV